MADEEVEEFMEEEFEETVETEDIEDSVEEEIEDEDSVEEMEEEIEEETDIDSETESDFDNNDSLSMGEEGFESDGDSFTEVSEEGWFSRIGGAIKGVIAGIVLFLVAFPVLWLNEGRAVKTSKSLEEGARAVVAIQADKVNPENEGKLVHLTGKADTKETLKDSVFGISVNAIKLIRNVQTYQWEENKSTKEEKKLGGKKVKKTTYSYSKVWNSSLIDSSSFKKRTGHQNPKSVTYSATTQIAQKVSLGAFELNGSLKSSIGGGKSLPAKLENLPANLKSKIVLDGNSFYFRAKQTTITDQSGNIKIMPIDTNKPKVGDQRISFTVVKPAQVSVIAKQIKNTFEAYKTKVGGTISRLEMGTVSAAKMFENAQSENTVLTWILRVVGFLLMFIGINLIFKPLSVIGDIVPFIGSIISFGTGIIAFIIATFFSVITIAIAWIVYRPVLGISLILVAVAISAGVYFAKKK